MKVADVGYVCLDFAPTLSGDGAFVWSTKVKSRGTVYPTEFCNPSSKIRKRMKSRKGMQFTVVYTYDHNVAMTGTRQWYSVDWSDGSPGLDSGWRYRLASGVIVDSSGVPTSDGAQSWADLGYTIHYGARQPWPYTATVTSSGSYRTRIRLVKS